MADEQVIEQPKFNVAEYIQQANESDAARRNGKPLVPPVKEPEPVKEAVKAPESEEEKDKRLSRSERRRLRAFEDASRETAKWQGKAEALQEMLDRMGGKSEAPPPTGEDDPEPRRAQYASDAEHQRALGRWDARQEIGKLKEDSSAKEQREQWESHLRAMDDKAKQDIAEIKDWDEVAKAAAEDENAPEWTIEEHPTLMGLIASSDMKARILYHFAKNPGDLEKMLEMSSDPTRQIRQFSRLEGRIENMYSNDEPDKTAAQAEEKAPKDRMHPAEAKAGRNSASERDTGKPRPSTEVAARGGSAPPEEPRTGSPAWHQRENERERLMRGR